MYDNEATPAFEILLEEMETIIDQLNQDGSRYFSLSKHHEARTILDKAEAVSVFRSKLKDLQKEWNSLEAQITRKSPEKLREGRKKKGQRLQRGLRTPEEEFRLPILESLIKLGGSAPANDVLNLVEKQMKAHLNAYDLQMLPSTPTSRWRNTAQWTRNTLVNEGLLQKNSPTGTWEISDAGRKFVQKVSNTRSGTKELASV